MNWSHFQEKLIPAGYSESDQEFIRSAFEFAQKAHEGQKRASGDPYFSHVFEVASNIALLRLDARTIAAALLHDTIEDCNITQADIANKFGKEVATLVEGVTKLDKIRYQGVQRNVESIRKMVLATAEDVRVVLLKLMDRLHNMQTIAHLPEDKQKRIARETLELYAPLAYRLGIGELKGTLQDLAFPVMYPEEAKWIKEQVETRVPEGRKYLEEEIKPFIEDTLLKDNVQPVAIDFRAKHHYSLWQKLLRSDMDFGRVSDLLAVRVIVRSIEDCYKTLGIIHQLWKPVPGRIKDYIALPKPNGYRSLHTTVFCEENRITEFQIRTPQMHEEAEYGIAAHWAYEESGKPKSGARARPQQLSWVRRLPEWHQEIGNSSDGEEFLESLKIDFFKDRIFVLSPKGEVFDLPEGATPVDFAYHIHTEVGNHMAGAKVNGKMVQFTHKLISGDAVEILTQKNKKPAPDWLTHVKTSLARGHIRAALRKDAELAQHAAHGKQREKCEVHIVSKNRVGLLKDISAVFDFYRISMQNVSMSTHNKTYPAITVTFQARDHKQIERLVTRLKTIENVEQITVKNPG